MGRGILTYIAFLLIALPFMLGYQFLVPKAGKDWLKRFWDRIEPVVGPYLAAGWVLFCVVFPFMVMFWVYRK